MDITELRKEPHLSSSSIGDYIDCGLLYKLGRIDKLPMEFRSDALEFGSVIHKVLEEHYRMKLEGNILSAKELHQIFEKYWRKTAEGKEDIRYSEGKDFGTLLLEGKELLTVYHNKMPDDQFRIIGIEEPFSFTVEGCPVLFSDSWIFLKRTLRGQLLSLIGRLQAGLIRMTKWTRTFNSLFIKWQQRRMGILTGKYF